MAGHSEAERNDPVWAEIRTQLEGKRKETFEALRDYPRQVAGCDTYYQYLAEQRAKISGELRQLDAIRRENRNLSTTLRHRRFLFTDSFLLLWKWRVG